jgi:hypothetical protein
MHRRAALDIAAITGSILARTSNCQNSEVRRDTRQSERKQNTLRGSHQSEQVAKQVASAPKRDPRQSERSRTTRSPPERAKANTLRGSHQSEQVAKQVASAPKRRDPRQSEQVAKQVASAPKRKTPDRSRGRREGKGLVRRSLATRLANNVHPISPRANSRSNISWNCRIRPCRPRNPSAPNWRMPASSLSDARSETRSTQRGGTLWVSAAPNGLKRSWVASPAFGSGKLLVPTRLARATSAIARPTNEGSHARSRPILTHGSFQDTNHKGPSLCSGRRSLCPHKYWMRSKQHCSVAGRADCGVEHGDVSIGACPNPRPVDDDCAARRRGASIRSIARHRGCRVRTRGWSASFAFGTCGARLRHYRARKAGGRGLQTDQHGHEGT